MKKYPKLWLMAGCLSALGLPLSAQVSLQPLESNPQLLDFIQTRQQNPNWQHRNGQVCPTTTVSLPFFDDFAKVDSFYPKCSHWQDQYAFISANYPYQPPTVGAATLDGLNQYGRPHQDNASSSVSNPADTLTSQLINLSGKSSNDNLYLSFYAQPQGYGDRPEEGDSLILEFKTRSGDWQGVWSQAGVPATVSTLVLAPFAQQFIFLQDTGFFHQDFQFRFRNLASITGNNDHWNIDYVYLDQNRSPNNVSYPDVAFYEIPASPLKRYTAMPLRHFVDTMLSDSLLMRCQNLSNVSGTLDRLYTVEDMNGAGLLLSSPVPALTYNPSPDSDDELRSGLFGNFAPYAPADTTSLLSTYTILNPTDFQNNPIFAHSDTVYRQTKLNNYFAYDDGSAEARLIAQGLGTEVAVRFRATVDDTLRGIYFHLPYFTNRNSELDFVNIKVWLSDLNNGSVFSRDIYRLRYVSGFNGFYYFELSDFADSLTPVFIPANIDFFVGWQQSSTIPVPVGFDRNNNAQANTFVHTNGSWQNIGVEGAILIRPLLSMSPDYPITSTEKLAPIVDNQQVSLVVYPNPHNGQFAIQSLSPQSPERVEIYNLMGQIVHQQPFANSLNLPHLPAGSYLLRVYYPDGRSGQQFMVKS